MLQEKEYAATGHTDWPAGGCPIDHHSGAWQKTAPLPELAGQPIEVDAFGVWHVRGYEETQAVLRANDTKQAGFMAELLDKMPSYMNPPVLFMEGQAHHEQRRQTARFFTPRTTDSQYRRFMEQFADEIVADFQRNGRADLSDLSLKLAVQVAARVVGLTNSRLPGMDKRIDRFLSQSVPAAAPGWSIKKVVRFLRSQLDMGLFYLLDVRPAINARRQQPQEDVISHLLASDYGDPEILTECITYGAAGMVTTREFISVAFWHCLETSEYRRLMLEADQETRIGFLHELLRLEPVVGRLYRRATADLAIASGGQTVIIPAGSLIDLHIYAANADVDVVGAAPQQVCPGRRMADLKPRVPAFVMGFGDGHHRCPGATIAMQETDIFLQRLLALPALRIEREPEIRYNDVSKGYELRQFMITTA